MRAITFLFAATSLLILCGCQPSILPFYSVTDRAGLPSLVGIWEPADGEEETWTITGDSTGYDVIHKTPERLKEYDLHVFKLREKYFADIVQKINYSRYALDPDLYLQQHLLARVVIEGDSLRVGIFNDEWFVAMIDDEAIKLPFVEMETGYLLTATPEQMRPVLIKYADDPDAFPMSTMLRVGN
jgi:hypothetical protein